MSKVELIHLSIALCLVVISGLSKAICDKINFHFEHSRFKNLPNWWNPQKSWENKHKWSSNKVVKYLLSTIFVGITDAWHLFGTVGRLSLFAILFLTITWWIVPILYVTYIITFHIFFTYIFEKK